MTDRGQMAVSPKESVQGWRDLVWRVGHKAIEDRVMLISAGVTYYLLLSLVPSLAVFVSIYGLFNSRSTVLEHVGLLVGILPSGGVDIIKDQLTRLTSTPSGELSLTLILSLVIALWSASAGISALFEAMNIAYEDEETRSFVARTLITLAFTLGVLIVVVLFLATLIVIPWILDAFYLGRGFGWLIRTASYALMLALILLGVTALYRWGPSRKHTTGCRVSPGAIFAVAGLAIVSVLYSWYAASFANYSITYGSLGALVGLLTWFWLSMIILITGAEINSEVERFAQGPLG